MGKIDISGTLSRGAHRLVLAGKKYGPTGFVIAGGAAMILAIGQAIKDTRNGGGEILDDYDKKVKKLKATKNDPDVKSYTEEQYKKDVRAAKADTTIDIVKHYKKTEALAALALGLTGGGYLLRTKQLKNTAIALAGVTAAFEGYRGNVIEDLGEEKDFEYLHNIKTRKVEKTVTDPETGEEKTVTEEEKVAEDTGDPDMPAGYSRFAKFFDESCAEWTKDPSYNIAYLLARQSEANRRLKRDGYLFLNDVYDMLGIPRTYEGQIYGWEYLKDNKRGDNEVDFGVHDGSFRQVRRFVNGYEPCILLDFNVDGDIMNTFRRHKGK